MKKVSKIKAKKLFEKGYIIRAVPNKLGPEDEYINKKQAK